MSLFFDAVPATGQNKEGLGEWIAGKVSEKQRRGSIGPRYSKKAIKCLIFLSGELSVCVVLKQLYHRKYVM